MTSIHRSPSPLSLSAALKKSNEFTDSDSKYFPLYNKDLLKDNLSIFYQNYENINRVLPIISEQTKLSLRLLDWFVTNYSKKYQTVYQLKNKEYFIVHLEYKAQLKAYHKEKFDPFCRNTGKENNIIRFSYKNKTIKTTVGQLNFFKWSIQNEVIDYVIENLQKIEKDMEEYNKNRRTRNNINTSYISATKTISQYHVNIVLDFS